jgi:GMP synthase (glutamine-hydrolysing)
MTEAADAATKNNPGRVHVPERSVPGAEPGLREVDKAAPVQATEEVLVLDFGGQYSQLIARRIREGGVFSELLPHDVDLERIRERGPRALVLSGGPASVYAEDAPELREELLDLGVPVLGICYGMQLMVH